MVQASNLGEHVPAIKRVWKSVSKLTSGAFVAMWQQRVDYFYAGILRRQPEKVNAADIWPMIAGDTFALPRIKTGCKLSNHQKLTSCGQSPMRS